MNTMTTKLLMIITLASVGSLGLAAGAHAKPDTATHMNQPSLLWASHDAEAG